MAYRKLLMIGSAIDIDDLRIPPANRLEINIALELTNNLESVLHGKRVH